MKINALLPGIILLISAACQQTLVTEPAPLPTLMVLPTTDPRIFQATETVSALLTRDFTLSQTPRATTTPSATPSVTPHATNALTATVTASPISAPVLPTRVPLPSAFAYGRSVEGRDLLAYAYGSGPHLLLLVGGIHGGFEANTVRLLDELAAHFERTPADVLPGIVLLLIPSANPDALERGETAAGRFNANGVDLNRNWGCDWSPEAVWRERKVNPGAEPFSEPETLALAALINDLQPSAVLFYHAAARGVFAGDCNNTSHSQAMAAVLGRATGYPYDQPFDKYTVSGTEANWVDGLGIPSADVELATTDETEFTRNLNGILAVQRWLLEEHAPE